MRLATGELEIPSSIHVGWMSVPKTFCTILNMNTTSSRHYTRNFVGELPMLAHGSMSIMCITRHMTCVVETRSARDAIDCFELSRRSSRVASTGVLYYYQTIFVARKVYYVANALARSFLGSREGFILSVHRDARIDAHKLKLE
jgi:hypothetical protein